MYSRVKQQGFTLYIVLVLMAIIATLVLAGGQTLNTEMRISSNDADKKYAFGLAEEALKAGELYALETIHPTEVLANPLITSSLEELVPRADVFFDEMVGSGKLFTEDCDNGLCAPAMEQSGGSGAYADTPAWKRDIFVDGKSIEYILSDANVSQSPRYIIEFLGPSADVSNTLYRVTARAWGRNATTEVTVQSVISINNQLEID
ncbi:hypothetical protein ADP71_05620 [Vitreoscilla sp. C1]|uniref:pilus assembly PilX family protein n=1 Tax=Vitreoscilla sp. (strain C1) TaxID=96942 RepID=UPI000CDCBA2E|nr:PilX N-terminal domain-containing pilus assembly protein [Vitreoscilla sp. C1]AUZ04342.1 hypothetical protein ADP71_05620 [Vitreoscilla sp. C1]